MLIRQYRPIRPIRAMYNAKGDGNAVSLVSANIAKRFGAAGDPPVRDHAALLAAI